MNADGFDTVKKKEIEPPEVTMADKNLDKYLYGKCGISGLDIENLQIRTTYQIQKIKVGF